MSSAPPDMVDQDLHAAATAMAQQSAFIRKARTLAGKDPSAVHDPQRAASSRVVDGKTQYTSGGVPPTPSPAASEPAPSGGGTSSTTPVSNDKSAAAPSTVRVKVGDKELEMPVDMLGSYIEKAQRAEAAIQEAETLKKVKVTDDAVALSVANWAKTATPEQMRAMQAVMRGERIPVPQADPLAEVDEDLNAPQADETPAVARLKEELRPALHAIEQLIARENQRSAVKADEDRQASVQSLMSKFEVFKDPLMAGLALRSMKNALAANAEQDVVKLVAEHAAEYGNFLRAKQSSNTAAGSQSAATPGPQDPGAASRPAMTGKDLTNKNVLNAVLGFLRSSAAR